MNDLTSEDAVSLSSGTHDRIAHDRPLEDRSSKAGETPGNAARQAALVALSRKALAGGSLESLLDAAAGDIARVMDAQLSKIAERLPDGSGFLIRAGRGWRPGVVGQAVLEGGSGEAAGYTAAKTSGPVVVEDLRLETRFAPPAVLLEHGVVSGLSVTIPRGGADPYGVLGVYTTSRREFTGDDREFLTGVANLLSFALQRIRSEEALRASEKRFRDLADTMPQMVWTADRNGVVTYFNRRWFEYTRMDEATAFLPGAWVQALLPEDRDSAAEAWREAVRTGKVFALECRYLHHAGGGFHWHLVRAVPVRDDDGGILQWFGTCTDVHDQKEAERELQELNETLEHRVEERTRSLIRNQRILRKVATQLALVEQKERRRLASELHDYLAQLLVAAQLKLPLVRRSLTDPEGQAFVDQLDDMLRESLTYTRTLIADLSPTVLYDHGLAAALTWLAERMAEHGLTVEVERVGDEVPVPEDRAVVTFQAVRELLFNVVKHAGVDRARVRVEHRDRELEVTVSDRGAGLPPAGDRDPVATGHFGLVNVRERMAGIGGSFGIRSVPGRGTDVRLTLPLDEPREDPDDPRQERKPPAARSGASGIGPRPDTVRVVLADDHARVREGLRATIESFPGLRVVGEARDGTEAVELVRVLAPDVVVLDVNMPRMNGIEAARLIHEEGSVTRVVAISVQNDRETEALMRAAGAVAYITKGSDLEALGRAILAAAGRG